MNAFTALQHTSAKSLRLCGIISGSAQLIMATMFIQAFCYGAKLVRDHKNTPGDIFWACLIAQAIYRCVSHDGSLQWQICSLINGKDPQVRTPWALAFHPFLTFKPAIESVFYTLQAIVVRFGGRELLLKQRRYFCFKFHHHCCSADKFLVVGI